MPSSRCVGFRLVGAFLTACAAAALLAGQAGAIAFQPFYEFTIAFQGHGSYTRTVASEGGSKLSEEASWQWNSVYPHVLVPTVASSPLVGASFPAIGLGQSGSGSWKITNTGAESEDCSNTGALALPKSPLGGGGGEVTVKRAAGRKGLVFNMYALDEYETTAGGGGGPLPCEPSNYWQSIILGFAGVGFKHTSEGLPDVHPLTAKLTVASSELKHGSFTKHVSVGASEMIPDDCGSGDGSTCTQDYTWSGTVKFTKHKFKP